MHVKLKGLAKVRKKLADGSSRFYFYAWRGGPLLRNAKSEPIQNPDDPQLQVAFMDAHKELRTRPAGTLGTLIADYRASPAFTGRADKTREEYRRYLDLIDDELGDIPLFALVNF